MNVTNTSSGEAVIMILTDVLLMLGFLGLIVVPCMVAMRTRTANKG